MDCGVAGGEPCAAAKEAANNSSTSVPSFAMTASLWRNQELSSRTMPSGGIPLALALISIHHRKTPTDPSGLQRSATTSLDILRARVLHLTNTLSRRHCGHR